MPHHDITDEVGSLDLEQPRAVSLDGQLITLVRTEQGVFAVDNTCTHAEASLADGFVMDNWIECPLHQARYDLATGERLDGPDCANLRAHPITIIDGRSFIDL